MSVRVSVHFSAGSRTFDPEPILFVGSVIAAEAYRQDIYVGEGSGSLVGFSFNQWIVGRREVTVDMEIGSDQVCANVHNGDLTVFFRLP
jgi:hypothetical protein